MGASGKTNVYVIKIYCTQCNTFLYKYKKRSNGALVKCHPDRIIDDYTKGDMRCPNCGQEFARRKIMKNKLVQKIIRGRVFVKGHLKR
ncbi:MAG TPA: hypothetical protein VE439_02995 [Anaerolineae bacterium]|nr:hypothetical protein [Anaerolineae bacterium]